MMQFCDLKGFGDLVTRNARRFPFQEAIVFHNTRLTWNEVNARVNALANGLLSLGVKKGDRVAILSLNCHQYVETYFANAKIGAPTVTLNYRLAPTELKQIIEDSGTSTLIVGEDLSASIAPFLEKFSTIERVISIGTGQEGMIEYEELVAQSSTEEPGIEINEDDLLLILYTSGTTGLPKGALYTHMGYLVGANNIALESKFDEYTRRQFQGPLFTFGSNIFLFAAIYVGATVILLKVFDPHKVVETIAKEKTTHTSLVPAMLYMLLDSVPNLHEMDLSSLQSIGYGAAPIALPRLKQAMDVFKGCEFLQAYGATEIGGGTLLKDKDHVIEGRPEELKRLESVGRPIIGSMLKIVDENNREVPTGTVGEIAMKAQSSMIGYWNDPEGTSRTIIDGWIHTGDMGYLDDGGYLFIADRKKDMIITGGFNVYPKEIENVIFNHPGVLDTAVIGIPDEKWGEAILALIQLKDDADVTREEILSFCQESLARYKIPKQIEFVDDFPRTPYQKIRKNLLREPYWQNRERKF